MRSYTQLTRDERYQIYALRKAGHSQKEIAGFGAQPLDHQPGTEAKQGIERLPSRDIFTFGPGRLEPQNRQERRDRTGDPKRPGHVELLRGGRSPEQISGWPTREEGVSVSHERIYQHVYEDKRRGGDLHRHLAARSHAGSAMAITRRGQIRERVSIDERPVGGQGAQPHW